MKKKKIRLLNNIKNEEHIISETELKQIYRSSNHFYLSKVAHKKVDSKIDLESNYTTLFILFILASFLDSMKDKIKISDNLKKQLNNEAETFEEDDLQIRNFIITQLLRCLFVPSLNNITTRISVMLNKYYNNGDEIKNTFKSEVMDIIEEYLLTFDSCFGIINTIDNENFDITTMIQEKYRKINSEKQDGKHIIKICSDRIMKNKKYSLSKYENEIFNILNKSLTLSQANYISNVLLKSWIENGGQIAKNDIYDLQLLSILDDAKTVFCDNEIFLVTFDGKIRDFYQNTNITNWNYINNFIRCD